VTPAAAETGRASGVGLATVTADGTVLDAWFPAPERGADAGPNGTHQMGTLELGGALGPDYSGLVRSDAPAVCR
jgi:2,3,4,5-tetrahydropyridine-2-carboxylate N-succinyltransferase